MAAKLKIVALTTGALVLLCALPAGAAAAKPEFKVEQWPAIIAGTQTEPFTLTTSGGTIKCEDVIFLDESVPSTSDPTMEPEPDFADCNVFGLTGVNATMNKCFFYIKLLPGGAGKATMDIDCPESKAIEFPGKACTIQVASQNNLGDIQFSNLTLEERIYGEFTLGEIEYTESANCNKNKAPTVTKNGTLKGTAEFRATTGFPMIAPQKLWIE